MACDPESVERETCDELPVSIYYFIRNPVSKKKLNEIFIKMKK